MNAIAGLILAGGLGSRLGGVSKAEIEIGGRRLLDICHEVLAPHCQSMLVSVRPGMELALPRGALAVPDRPDAPGGPMAGLASAVLHFDETGTLPEALVCLAVDTPLVPPDYVPQLMAGLPAGAAAGYAVYAGNGYPTNAVWRRAALSAIADRARAGTLPDSPRAMLRALDAVPVHWPPRDGRDPFASLNTFEDLRNLDGRRATPEFEAGAKSGLGKAGQTR